MKYDYLLILEKAKNSSQNLEDNLLEENKILFELISIGNLEMIFNLFYIIIYSENIELLKIFLQELKEVRDIDLLNSSLSISDFNENSSTFGDMINNSPQLQQLLLKPTNIIQKQFHFIGIFLGLRGFEKLSFHYVIQQHFQNEKPINIEMIKIILENTNYLIPLIELYEISNYLLNFPEIVQNYLSKFDLFILIKVKINIYQIKINNKTDDKEFPIEVHLENIIPATLDICIDNNEFYQKSNKSNKNYGISVYSHAMRVSGKCEKSISHTSSFICKIISKLSLERFEKLVSFTNIFGQTIIHEAFLFKDQHLISTILNRKDVKDKKLINLFRKDSFANTPEDYKDINYKDTNLILSEDIIKEYYTKKEKVFKNVNKGSKHSFFFTLSICDEVLDILYSIKGVKGEFSYNIASPVKLLSEFKNYLSDKNQESSKRYSYKEIATITDQVTDSEERSLRKYLDGSLELEGINYINMLKRMGYSLVKTRSKSEMIIELITKNYTNLKKVSNSSNFDLLKYIKELIVEILFFSLKDSIYTNTDTQLLEIKAISKNTLKDDSSCLNGFKKVSFQKFQSTFKTLEDKYIEKISNQSYTLENNRVDTSFFEELSTLTEVLYNEDIIKLYTDLIYCEYQLETSYKNYSGSNSQIWSKINAKVQEFHQYCYINQDKKDALVPDTLDETEIYFLKGLGLTVNIFYTTKKPNLSEL